jgi:hypothetical protein
LKIPDRIVIYNSVGMEKNMPTFRRFISTFALLLIVMLIACAPVAPEVLSAAVQASAEAAIAQTPSPLPPTSTATHTPIPTASATATIVMTETPDLWATIQVKMNEEKTATQAALDAAQAAGQKLLETFRKDGSLTFQAGKVIPVDDFSESMAQIGWYRWWTFDDIDPLADYVILSHIKWQYPDEYKMEVAGSCGFVMRLVDNDRHVIFLLNTTNTMSLNQMTVNGYARADIRSSWIQFNRQIRTREKSGEADIAIVAEKERISLYIDGYKDSEWIVARTAAGKIGYMIMSDTNMGYGIKCSFSDTRIYPLSEK